MRNTTREAQIARLEEAVALDASAVVERVRLGRELIHEMRMVAAFKVLREALAIDDQCAPAWVLLGIERTCSAEFDTAEQCFRQVLEICPDGELGDVARHNLQVVGRRRGAVP